MLYFHFDLNDPIKKKKLLLVINSITFFFYKYPWLEISGSSQWNIVQKRSNNFINAPSINWDLSQQFCVVILTIVMSKNSTDVLFYLSAINISTSWELFCCFFFIAARLSAIIFFLASSRALAASFIFSVRSGEDSGVSFVFETLLLEP